MTHTTLIYWFAAHCLTLNLTLKEADVTLFVVFAKA